MKNTSYLYRQFEKTMLPVITILFMATGILAAFWTNRSLKDNVRSRSCAELEYTAREQSRLINKEIERQFEPLRVLAAYLEDGDFESTENRNMTEAMIRVNRWCTIAMTDADGNAVNYKGEQMGNVSDRGYFSDIIAGADCVVQYLSTTRGTKEPRFLFSVPVYNKNNEFEGVLFASKQVSVLEPILLSNAPTDDFISIYLVTGDGTILSANENAHQSAKDNNFFDSYRLCESRDTALEQDIRAAMEKAESGSFQYQCSNAGYAYYVPTGINDWYLFVMADQKKSEEKYAASLAEIRENVIRVMVIFCLLMVFTIFLFLYHIKKIRRL